MGILRLSGPSALALGRSVTAGLPSAVTPRRAYLARFVGAEGEVLDEGLFLYFRAPHSFTGEDVVELHAHGSPALLALLQRRLLASEGARAAQPGEFTRRAFLNGRMDLARADAVADLVAATSEAQLRAAAARATGGWSRRVARLRAEVLALRSELEGELDFPAEAEETPRVAERLRSLVEEVGALEAQAARESLLHRGARVVLFGPVNAGKSTLFNALAGAPRALVDPEPGTTRDALEATCALGGLAVTLVDTAGLRDEPGRLEALGIGQARAALERADLGVLVVPPGAPAPEVAAWEAWGRPTRTLRVGSKADLGRQTESLAVSAQTGEGLDALRARLAALLWAGAAQAAGAVSDLQAASSHRAAEALRSALTASAVSTLEVVSGELGLSLQALAEMTGEDASDELLDAVFRRFCIGK